jgi:N6-adenosine-specific RNA methylase IME4
VSGKYRTIVADPPWPFQWQGGAGGRRANATRLGYETMDVDAICRLGADELLSFWPGNGTLFLWTTQEALHSGDAQLVAGAWGYRQRVGEIIWKKPNFGTGVFPRIGHETCLIYKRGKGSLRSDAPRNVHSVQTWRQPYASSNGGKMHSAKPDAFYDLVEQGCEGPYLELFARRARLGDWTYWGDESLGTAQMPEAVA